MIIAVERPRPISVAWPAVAWMPGSAVTESLPVLPKVLAGIAVFGLGVYCLGKLFEEPKPSARRRSYNWEPLSWQDREYVSFRDGWRCTYCGKRVTRATRHVDHSVSRANGGSNHLNNLRLACAPCNLSKGVLNSRQFVTAW